jgi:hypothetical protein
MWLENELRNFVVSKALQLRSANTLDSVRPLTSGMCWLLEINDESRAVAIQQPVSPENQVEVILRGVCVKAFWPLVKSLHWLPAKVKVACRLHTQGHNHDSSTYLRKSPPAASNCVWPLLNNILDSRIPLSLSEPNTLLQTRPTNTEATWCNKLTQTLFNL